MLYDAQCFLHQTHHPRNSLKTADDILILPAKSSTHLNSLLYFDNIVNSNKLGIIIAIIHVYQIGPREIHFLIGVGLLFFS